MNTEQTVTQLQQLKLHGMAGRYEALLDLPVHQQPEAHALLAMLAEAETGYRSQQRTGLYLRMSKLRYHALLEQIHCSQARELHSGTSYNYSAMALLSKSQKTS